MRYLLLLPVVGAWMWGAGCRTSDSVELAFEPARLVYDYEPSWSPDGERIAFCSNRSGSFRLYTVGIDSGEVVEVTHTVAPEGRGDWFPTWSPDGGSLAFMTDRDGRRALHVLDLATGVESPLTGPPLEPFERACWSLDGADNAKAREVLASLDDRVGSEN